LLFFVEKEKERLLEVVTVCWYCCHFDVDSFISLNWKKRLFILCKYKSDYNNTDI
jgi:hypothetical protein